MGIPNASKLAYWRGLFYSVITSMKVSKAGNGLRMIAKNSVYRLVARGVSLLLTSKQLALMFIARSLDLVEHGPNICPLSGINKLPG